MTKRAFGDLENSILNILKSERKMTVKQVQEALGGEDKYTTVMTVMSRLVEKRLLERERLGARYSYYLVKNPKHQKSMLKRLSSKLFGMKTAEVVSYLIKEADDLTPADFEEVEKMIAQARKKTQEGQRDE